MVEHPWLCFAKTSSYQVMNQFNFNRYQMYKNYNKILCRPLRCFYKILFIMKLTTIILLATLLQVSATGFAQKVTFVQKNSTLKEIFGAIRKQTGYDVVASSDQLFQTVKIDAGFRNAPLEKVLDKCLENLPFSYAIDDHSVIISRKEKSVAEKIISLFIPKLTVKGVVKVQEKPLGGVSILVERTRQVSRTKDDGSFSIEGLEKEDVLVVSYIGYQQQKIRVADVDGVINIELKPSTNVLDEVRVLAYGQKTSQRTNTGSTVSIDAAVLEKTPTSDPIAALQGRAAGLLITNNSGLPGAQVSVQIRGINTLNMDGKARMPLYIVDGVPFTSSSIATLTNIGVFTNGSSESPFKSIDPSSIANIEVLKDADATAIYGARGANGVILITTKRGKAGQIQIGADVYASVAKIPHYIDMLNTEQYLDMRRQAAINDGIEITDDAFPDLTKWSQTKYTNWQKEFFDKTALTQNAELNITGGSNQTRFLLGGGYRNEKTVYNTRDGLKSGNIRFNADHNSKNNKLNLALTLSYSGDKNTAIALDPVSFYALPPNYSLYNEDGSLNWAVPNPIATSLSKMENKSKSAITNFVGSYKVLPDLTLKASVGYTDLRIRQMWLTPIAAQDPTSSNPQGYTYYANNKNNSFTFEPQADYVLHRGNSTFRALLGGTYIDNRSSNYALNAYGFTDDALLGNVSAAERSDTTQLESQYRFLSAFTRIGYEYQNELFVNATLRRDGSSRFAPGKQFGDFWSLGAAWIFTERPWMKKALPFLSMGKLRASYGLSGNDNIGDYSYFVNYEKTFNKYQGTGLFPKNLFNSDYQWEENKKFEAALELGFLNDAVMLTVNYYRNRSGNQLVLYPLASQVGVSGVNQNMDAKIQNSGWEFMLNTSQIKHKDFSWTSSFNLSVGRNKLLSFPDLANSAYKDQYAIGKSLSLFWGFDFQKIDPQTGKPVFRDVDGNGNIEYPNDFVPLSNLLPTFYGGFTNNFSYKRFDLDISLSFKRNERNSILNLSPGATLSNQPIEVLDRWQSPENPGSRIAYTTDGVLIYAYNSSLATAFNNSYIRLSNVSFGYSFSEKQAGKLGMKNLRVYAMGNNLFTLTNYPGFDPETGISMPTLRSFTFGLKTTF
ncbi:TonB-linked outer membrane protein, SusC/RagA family [Pedobacter terrae]|uniref:TonB-linked outer membrane protein, SusC/RagA family n=2 Tax=Pedobacter terrae TaxID=405671 RepID=A0A1G8BTP1_9SPHI|nr:TonB-linked outer membrane protein, SusC/RagA family [Pedobacter terrae]